MMNLCPCGSEQTYAQCCRLLHEGKAAITAEALMRSRYAAYVLGDTAYIHRSWHSSTRPSKKSLVPASHIHWEALQIVRTEAGLAGDDEGIVEFIAYYKEQNTKSQLHEISRFKREKGRWVYLDALPSTPN